MNSWLQKLSVPVAINCEWSSGVFRCKRAADHVERVDCGGVIRWLCAWHADLRRPQLRREREAAL